MTVGGYAGTGKTTLLCELRRRINVEFPKLSVAFVTFTGKASSVLKTKLDTFGINYEYDYVGTIHGLIYKVKTRYDPKLKSHVVVGWDLKDPDDLYHDVIIIDEASMVSKEIWDDLKSFGKAIIGVGDHGQLPPVGDRFNLLSHTDFQLTEIHRQALNSPIIWLSQKVRREGYIPDNKIFSPDVFKLSWRDPQCKKIWNEKVTFDEDLIVLCGFNTTRCALNDKVRKRLKFHKSILPYPGERIVCLANDHSRKIMNGQIGTLLWIMPENHKLYRVTIDMGNADPVECTISDKCFSQVTYTMHDRSKFEAKQKNYAIKKGIDPVDYFDYGYSISVHKSQGSEWKRVVVFEQRSSHWDDELYARWLYTAVTRASEKLFIISDFYG
jgi:exodeoxyribonuclease-5